MKVLLVIWLITVAHHALSHQAPHDHLCLKKNNRYLRHPYNCHKFIRCSHQRAYEFQCPANLMWHHEIKSCDFSYRTQCKLNDLQEKENNELKKVERKIKEELEYELTRQTGIGNIFAFTKKVPQNVQRNTDNKQKCQTTVRENVKTADFIQHTVQDVSDGMLREITKRNMLTEPKIESMITMSFNLQNPTNPPSISTEVAKGENRKNLLAFPFNSTKNPHKVLTANTSEEIKDEEQKTVSLKELSSSIYPLETSRKNHASESKQEAINSEIKLKNQNSFVQITAEINPVNLTEQMLTHYSAKNSSFNKTMTQKETNSVNLTEINHHPGNFFKKKYSSLNTSTDNSTVKIADDEIDNISLHTKSTASNLNSTEASATTYNRNIITKYATTAKVNSCNLTQAKLTSYATESINSTALEQKIISISLTELEANPVILSGTTQSSGNTLSLTDIPTIKIKYDENENISSALKYTANVIYSTKSSVNLTESVLTPYSTESFNENVNSTMDEPKTNSVHLMQLKDAPITSTENVKTSVNALTDNATVKLTENKTITTTAKDNAYLFNSTESFTENNMNENILTESVLQITAKENAVGLTETILRDYFVQNFTFNSTKSEERTSAENLTKITNLPVTLTESTLNIFELTEEFSVKLTDEENESIFLTTKNPMNSTNFIENFRETSNINLTEATAFKIKYRNMTDNLTETAFTQYSRQHSTNILDRTKLQEETSYINLIEITSLPVTSSEITPNMNSLNLTDNNTTVNPEDGKINQSVNLTAKDPIETYKLYNSTKFGLQIYAENNSVNLTESSLTDYLFKATVKVVPDKKVEKHFLKKQHLVANKANRLTEALTKMTKARTNPTEPSKLHNNFKISGVRNLAKLSSGWNKSYQTMSTTPTVATTLLNIFPYDSATIHDPRFPFRSIDCQGPNNRRQLKAIKCYQYYQCFAGWAFLLNCHEGYKFETKEEQCALDVNQECDFD